MKQIFSSAIIMLAIGLIVAYFGFYLEKEYVELRYTISEKIPTKFIERSTTESVQQLVVKNNGSVSANKIQIKIKGYIEEYGIIKNSISDDVEEHNSKGYFEAVYSSLPPGAQFSYILKTTGEEILIKNIEITHNKGKAKEALASDKKSIDNKISTYFFIFIFIIYIFTIASQARSIAIDHFESKGNYTEYYEYLNRRKPFYIPLDKWNSIRREYIKKKEKSQYLHRGDIEGQESYKILNQDKPEYLTSDEWELLKENSIKCLTDQLTYSIKASSHYTNYQKYFTIKQPKSFPDSKWQEIVEEINENYISLEKQKQNSFFSTEKTIREELSKDMPMGMLPAYWDEYKVYLQDLYYKEIYRCVLRETDPIIYLKNIDLSVLNYDKKDSLNDLAYRIQLLHADNISSLCMANKFIKDEKPEWLKQEDLEELIEKAEAYICLDISTKKYESLLNTFKYITSLTPLEAKPSIIDDDEWNKIIDIEMNVSNAAVKIKEDKLKLEYEEGKTKDLKDKVLKQLSIIDGVINDPESIDRIESYDNPFSEGNFENLRKVGKHIMK